MAAEDERTSRELRRFLRRASRATIESFRESQWRLPAFGAVTGALLAVGLALVGDSPEPDEWTVTVGGARTGLLSLLSIVFAGLSIVLAVASVTAQNVVGRYSLRMMRIYLRESRDTGVIAVFTMTATFIVVVMFRFRSLPVDAPAPIGGVVVSVILLVFSGGMMIWHISSISKWFRVDRAVRRVARLTLRTAHAVERQYREASTVPATVMERPPEAVSIAAPSWGYVEDVDTERLLELALAHDAVIVIDHGPGRSVVAGETIGWLAPAHPGNGDLPERAAEAIDISDLRDLNQDPGYGIVVLVDIAIMALSPAVNDPNTAVQVVGEMTFLFPQLAQLPLGPFGWSDSQGRKRVVVNGPTFGDYVEMATTQIVLYGSGDPVVVQAVDRFVGVLETLDLAEHDRIAVDALAARRRTLQRLQPGSATTYEA